MTHEIHERLLKELSGLEMRLRLRQIALAALADCELSWEYISGPLVSDVHVETRPKKPGRSKIRFDPNKVGPFVASANPGMILRLLDELDRQQQQIESLEATVRVRERERDAWEVAYLRANAKIPRKDDE